LASQTATGSADACEKSANGASGSGSESGDGASSRSEIEIESDEDDKGSAHDDFVLDLFFSFE